MTKLFEGMMKLGFMTVVVYLTFKHWVGATNVAKTLIREPTRLFVSLAEPAVAAKKL